MSYDGFIFKSGTVRLSNYVKIREEYFGGIVFHINTGDTLEIDHEAYNFFVWLREIGGADIRVISRKKSIRSLLPVLMLMNILEYSEKKTIDMSNQFVPDYGTGNNSLQKNQNFNTHNFLSAPETVHLAVTYRCGESCPDCYVRRYNDFVPHELNCFDMCGIIDVLADNGVFQLAIGGGEPFLRPDLFDIARHASARGLAVHITTGQYILKPQWTDTLKHIKSLHIGIKSEELIYDTTRTLEKLRVLAETAYNVGISIGANLILTRFTIRNIETLTELLLECGFKRLIFLRYKPILDCIRWESENPGKEELELFKNILTRMKNQYPDLMIRIDCASVFLMRDMNPQTAIRAGIKGCAVGERIISVAPDGSVYPCSQLVGDAYNAGNLTRDSFEMVWKESNILNKYRRFRSSTSFADGICGHCDANSFCGGCRVFAEDTLGSERVCPVLSY